MRNVPQSKYDISYYNTSCEGYTKDGTPGKRLLTLLSHMNPDAKTILDIGCGRGEIAKFFGDSPEFINNGGTILSMDYSIAAMNRFHEINCDSQPFIRHDISQGFNWVCSAYFDCIIMADIIEHLYSEQLIVVAQESLRVLKSGGMILIDTPIIKDVKSELHVDVKGSIQEVQSYFKGTIIIKTHWYMEPNHCNIILCKE